MPISALAHVSGRCVGVTDASGKTHDADFVCVAAGPWTDDLLTSDANGTPADGGGVQVAGGGHGLFVVNWIRQ